MGQETAHDPHVDADARRVDRFYFRRDVAKPFAPDAIIAELEHLLHDR